MSFNSLVSPQMRKIESRGKITNKQTIGIHSMIGVGQKRIAYSIVMTTVMTLTAFTIYFQEYHVGFVRYNLSTR